MLEGLTAYIYMSFFDMDLRIALYKKYCGIVADLVILAACLKTIQSSLKVKDLNRLCCGGGIS